MKNDWSAVIFIMIYSLCIILILTFTSCFDYESVHIYEDELPIPPGVHSECDDVGQIRRYEYGDYAICIECKFDETGQYGYYKYWEEIECEK